MRYLASWVSSAAWRSLDFTIIIWRVTLAHKPAHLHAFPSELLDNIHTFSSTFLIACNPCHHHHVMMMSDDDLCCVDDDCDVVSLHVFIQKEVFLSSWLLWAISALWVSTATLWQVMMMTHAANVVTRVADAPSERLQSREKVAEYFQRLLSSFPHLLSLYRVTHYHYHHKQI